MVGSGPAMQEIVKQRKAPGPRRFSGPQGVCFTPSGVYGFLSSACSNASSFVIMNITGVCKGKEQNRDWHNINGVDVYGHGCN